MSSRTQASLVVSGLLGGCLLLGCGESSRAEEPDSGADAGATPDGATTSDGGPAADAAAAEAADAGASLTLRPQTNASFETAQRIEPDELPMLQDERSFDQIDYYVFSGAAGEFYEISTDRGMFMPDNVISLYDQAHELIARNDDGRVWSGEPVDARLVVRLQHSGDYFVTVEDLWTPAAFFSSGFPLLFYHLRVRALTEDTEGVAIARDGVPAAVSFVEDAKTGFSYATLLAELGDGERTFDFAGRPGHALIGRALSPEETGFASSEERGEIRVDDDDMHALCRVDRALGQDDFHPPVGEAAYHLTLGAVDAAGANAFHAIDLVMLPDNPVEREEDTNGELAGAEAIAFDDTTWRRGLVLLRLPADDVDYFQIEVMDGESVSVLCEAESGGSGVRGLQAELLDDDGMLASAEETPDANLSIPSMLIESARTVYLRVTTDGTSGVPDVEPWARCSIDVGP